jgi:hypothetical protein
LHAKIKECRDSNNLAVNLTTFTGLLSAVRHSLDIGILPDPALTIEATIAADYLGQAEHLLDEGQTGQYDHVPAAVLAGAVLEKALRSLCDQQTPPIDTNKANGEPKTMDPMIDDLKKVGVFNALKAKQLKSWAGIRNAAAHGRFSDFTRADVEQMLPGITTFLVDYLG